MSNAQNKVECSNDCAFYGETRGCLFSLQIKQNEALHKTNGAEQQGEGQDRPFAFVQSCDPAEVLDVLSREHPQTIAHVLSYLEPPQASTLLQFLPAKLQGETALRIATMDRVSLEIIRGIERSMEKKLSASDPCGDAGGTECILEILEIMDKSVAEQIIQDINDKDPELAEYIKKVRLSSGGGIE
jgi:flagellar motor switch protein FliG